MEQLGPCWTNFRKILYLNIFRESVDKIKIPLKPRQEGRTVYMKTAYIYDGISPNPFYNEKCCKQMLPRKYTHFMSNNILSENRAACEITRVASF